MIELGRPRSKGSPSVELPATPSMKPPLLGVLARISLAVALREASAEEPDHRTARPPNSERAANDRGQE